MVNSIHATGVNYSIADSAQYLGTGLLACSRGERLDIQASVDLDGLSKLQAMLG
jgi:hypothetical protein